MVAYTVAAVVLMYDAKSAWDEERAFGGDGLAGRFIWFILAVGLGSAIMAAVMGHTMPLIVFVAGVIIGQGFIELALRTGGSEEKEDTARERFSDAKASLDAGHTLYGRVKNFRSGPIPSEKELMKVKHDAERYLNKVIDSKERLIELRKYRYHGNLEPIDHESSSK